MDHLFYALATFIWWSNINSLDHQCITVDIQSLTCNYIPQDIPNGLTSISLINFMGNNKTYELNSSHFMSENWKNINSLKLEINTYKPNSTMKIMEKCFHGLKSLQELHINIPAQIELHSDVFVGLDSLILLDLSKCVLLNLSSLVKSLNGSNKLSNLETLKASKLNIHDGGIQFDTQFAEALTDKQITSLDFSDTKITQVNINACLRFLDRLKNVNLSYCKMSNINVDNKTYVQKLKNINVLDMSHAPITWLIPSAKIINRTWLHSNFPTKWNYFLYPKIVNASFSIRDQGLIWVENSTYKVDVPFQWNSEEMVVRQNNIKYLDIKMECFMYKAFTIKYMDAVGNEMEFLHPSILECFPNLVKFDLANNKLYKMAHGRHLLFQQLFQSLSNLQSINLSFNQLRDMPERLFIKNHNLELIDCSHNELEQVTFTLKYLHKLKTLNLQYNRIKILSSFSINNLNRRVTIQGNTFTLDLGNNPISCSKCAAKQFLYWLTHTKSVNISITDLACITSENMKRKIDMQTLDDVNSICKQRLVIIATTLSVGLIILIILTVIVAIYRRHKRANERIKRGELINRLQEGHYQNEFVVFLSYSSEDKDFVDNYLIDNFNETLQQMTGINRNLVCTGDLYLRPGFGILDEVTSCIERASAFVVVVSDSYNLSPYCHNELDLANRLQKPILLFIKEIVDESLMTPVMKSLFQTNVRVLWAFENEEYTMTTSWDNVCVSLLDLIIKNQDI